MRLKNFPRLLNPARYSRLRRDFFRPWQALLAASGVMSGEFTLSTRDGETLRTNRADRPLWEAYFNPGGCRVEIERGLFHVIPVNPAHADYYIQGASGGFTWQPQRYTQPVPPLVTELQQQEWSVYSQHGEDGVIQALLQRIPVQHRFVVEFGAYDGIYMSNSRYLIERQDWNAFLIEADPRFYHALEKLYRDHPRVKIKHSFVTEENINRLFREAGVPRDLEVLSIDVDGPDYYLWRALTEFEPRIVVVEYNSSIDAETEYVIPEDKVFEWGGTAREGASLRAFYNLGLEKGYQPIYSELYGANLFFVHRDIADHFNLEGITPEALYQPPQFGELAGTDAPSGRGYR
jgi:hypothetical protein